LSVAPMPTRGPRLLVVAQSSHVRRSPSANRKSAS
jgi:hypothetical protein